MYAEGMSGATAKSAPRNAAVDEGELGKLDRQEYWLRVAQAKLLLDLVFVCACSLFPCVDVVS